MSAQGEATTAVLEVLGAAVAAGLDGQGIAGTLFHLRGLIDILAMRLPGQANPTPKVGQRPKRSSRPSRSAIMPAISWSAPTASMCT